MTQMHVSAQPAVVAFDMIETVFSLESLRGHMVAAGLPGHALEAWFAQTLRDAFALEVTEVYKPFKEIAAGTLDSLLVKHGSRGTGDASAILRGFAELEPHPDADAAFQRLHSAGIRLIGLTNGGAAVTRQLVDRAGFARYFEQLVSIETMGHWKPQRQVYLHAARTAGVAPSQMTLVAAHPWDIHGASRAGLMTAFVARGLPYPSTMDPPHFKGDTLNDISEVLSGLRGDIIARAL